MPDQPSGSSSAALSQLQSFLGGGGTAGPVGPVAPRSSKKDEGVVYWGNKAVGTGAATVSTPGSMPPGVFGPPKPKTYSTRVVGSTGSDYRSETEVRGQVYSWYGTKDFDKWGDRLVKAGLIEEDQKQDLAVLNDWWQKVIDESVKFTAAGKRLTPWNIVDLFGKTGYAGKGGANGAGGGGARGFTGSKSHRSTSIDLTDPATAKAIANDALSRHLGRAANDAEIAQFKTLINAAERDNPTVTNTTAQYVDGEQMSSSSTTSGGMTAAGRDQIVADQAMKLPEYGAYQAAGTYLNALFGVLDSPV